MNRCPVSPKTARGSLWTEGLFSLFGLEFNLTWLKTICSPLLREELGNIYFYFSYPVLSPAADQSFENLWIVVLILHSVPTFLETVA